jgi:signal transduction histidine kinase
MRRPLRCQIMLPMAALMLVTVVAVGGVGAWLAARAAKSRIESQIAGVTHILADSNFPLTEAVLRQMKALSGADMILVDGQGNVISSSGPNTQMAALLETAPAPSDPHVSFGNQIWIRHDEYFHTTVPIPDRRTTRRGAVLHILYSEDEYRRAWQRAVYPSFGFMALALPVLMFLAAATAAHISRRVSRLQAQVNRIAQGDFRQLAVDDRDDEIRALGQAVNRMALMLARYETDIRHTERMRTLAQLGGGIAHQIRNSVTGCGMALDLHAQECTLGDTNETLDVARRQLQLMEQYVQQFLQLGKPADKHTVTTVDLAVLLNDLLPLVQPAAQHSGVKLHIVRTSDRLTVVGSAGALSQLIINLLLNAIEAAAQGSIQYATQARVVVDASATSLGVVTLTVTDSGPGPAPDVHERLFEPFVSEKPDGVGLGLSVAREVVEQHAGRIYWRRSNGMTQFSVELPRRQLDLFGTMEEQGEAIPATLAGPTMEIQRA